MNISNLGDDVMSDPKKYENNEPFGEIIKSINQFFHEKPVKGFLQQIDDFFKSPFPPPFHVETSETENEYIVSAELPGINKDQIQLDMLDHHITITIQYTEEFTQEDENQQIVKSQRSIQRSSRTIPIPQPFQTKKVKTTYENGLLQITFPKQKGKRILLD
jgi:HSP20 family protein